MVFESDYWHSMDERESKKFNLDPGTLGISTPPFRDQVESLRTRIFQGASRIELGFTGAGKGNLAQGSTTPEQYGREEREAIRHLAKLNEVQLSTHATFGIGGLSGFNPQEGVFSKEASEHALHEVERAIDFAADTAKGGPIVLHTQEFPRPISSVKPGVKGEFEGYPGEEKEGMIYFADKRTGKVEAIKKDVLLPTPKYEDTPNARELKLYKRNERGDIEFEKKTFYQYIEDKKKEGFNDRNAELEALKEFEEREIERLRADKERFDRDVKNVDKVVKSLIGLKESYEKILQQGEDKEAVRAILRQRFQVDPILRSAGPTTQDEQEEFLKNPEKFVDKEIKDLSTSLEYYKEGVVSYGRQINVLEDKKENLAHIEEVGVQRSADTIARAAIFAYDKERTEKLEKPLFVAPENLFDTSYGSDPRELRKIIEASREKMTEKLVEERRMNKEQATKIAEDHIKATFDIGHLNTWRKYFKGSSEEFNKWVLKEVEDLQKRKIIGHVHLSDNFGYYDEHVSPGYGNAPVKEFVEKLKELGYKGTIIVEPGHQDSRAWTEAMRNLHSPIYRSKSWTEIESGYFGKSYNPPYVVGGYAPDVSLGDEHRDWKFWSGVSIE